MKKIVWLLCLCLSTISYGQEAALKASAIRDAKHVTTSYLKENVEELITYTHPDVIKALGGKDTVTKILKETFENAKKSNINVVKNATGKLLDFKKEHGEYRCLIEKITVTEVPGRNKRIVQKNTMFGFYNSKLKHWQFVDGNKLVDGMHKNYFKDFKTAIAIPKMDMKVEDM